MPCEAMQGTWVLVKAEQFEEFLKEMGANWFVRKTATKFPSKTEIIIEEQRVILRTHTMGFTLEDNLILGESQEKKMPYGASDMMITASWDGEALILKMEPTEEGRGKAHEIRRELLSNNELLTTITCGDVVSKRYFKRSE